ncbi:MAG: hypothetical protein ACYTFQ_26035 [Planctomycetota bacterium]|jgi:hypothetical protein
MQHATYIGPIEALQGETALILVRGATWMAQFDRHNVIMPAGSDRVKPGTKLAFGWHTFSRYDWSLNA